MPVMTVDTAKSKSARIRTRSSSVSVQHPLSPTSRDMIHRDRSHLQQQLSSNGGSAATSSSSASSSHGTTSQAPVLARISPSPSPTPSSSRPASRVSSRVNLNNLTPAAPLTYSPQQAHAALLSNSRPGTPKLDGGLLPSLIVTEKGGGGFSGPGTQVVSSRDSSSGGAGGTPTIFGLPLKYVSLVTLAVQNAALSIVMHYSRVSTPASRAYSPAAAVLLNELLKGTISFLVALYRAPLPPPYTSYPLSPKKSFSSPSHHQRAPSSSISHTLKTLPARTRYVVHAVFSPDCWKLSIPAVLYVIQNSLQFVAIANLPVATFQVTYQMKILTTAAFSVLLLGKRLGPTKWLSLLFLALGVGIVQIQTASSNHAMDGTVGGKVGSAAAAAPLHVHIMHPIKGFSAVSLACFTSGLAGVYFEMVLKGSQSDLWVRNVQLSLFSLIPAVLPLYHSSPEGSSGVLDAVFKNFGGWAWATVAVQVAGGLVTAVVIKYSDNILKGFATSLSIILSFLASVALFDFRITPSFVLGAGTVLTATWMYNQPDNRPRPGLTSRSGSSENPHPSFPGSPIGRNDPIIGYFDSNGHTNGHSNGSLGLPGSRRGSAQSLSSLLRFNNSDKAPPQPTPSLAGKDDSGSEWGGESKSYLHAPYGSPYPSRTPSPAPSVDAQGMAFQSRRQVAGAGAGWS